MRLKLSLGMFVVGLSFMGQAVHADDHATSQEPSMKAQLQALADGASKRIPADKLVKYKAAIETVKASGVEASAKQVGDQAADGVMPTWKGDSIRLSDAWQEGPVVLMWYRGGWCPYCNIQLRAMQKQLDTLGQAGAKLIVVSPELPAKAKETAEANDLSMVAAHDKNNQLARKYGIVFELPDSIADGYAPRLLEYNGSTASELPLSATYVIDTNGKITYAFLDADYKNRAAPKEIIAAVKAISK
ncbi:Peroxiredoxin [Neorhodopirellula lusitana]|uniref:thioredoxin-dependent peroxiredoxin n=1 Tax=Neorhodopirellula lusitana TaxID=445327 RepID=A0ABY1PS04_9BACT|nr:peroxiredoxin-like family protein [Neorhodopirellula lusitana]SMP44005.1 Peroxiredoxin [Neorhodopirellula lusitana]